MSLHLTRGSISTLIYSVKLPNIFIVAVVYGAQSTHQQQQLMKKETMNSKETGKFVQNGTEGETGRKKCGCIII